MEYNFREIEQKWIKEWRKRETYKVTEDPSKEKFYALSMFPYPSGAGLHVGHPLGYIASDIYARYKKHQGYNVLHPMGYDSFGLPAEQYAIETGTHPAETTEKNIARYREQLDKLGFNYDWSREVRTSDPSYYKWTQWIFKQIFNSWYNNDTKKTEPISTLIEKFNSNGSYNVNAAQDEEWFKALDLEKFPFFGEYFVGEFTATDWQSMNEEQQQLILMHYRLTYLANSWVNWCPALGTVLANDEVKDGKSERGGHPVVQKLMRQWSMRISAFAQRLLDDLDTVDWSDSIKEIQRNWIGRSKGASVKFSVAGHGETIEVFTTRPDTIFGVDFVTLAPEHPLVNVVTTAEQKADITAYVQSASLKSERDRQSDVKNITGCFTGAYCEHPFTGKQIPIWIGDYVLASYGTGAVMAVPSGDQRDWDFATHFKIEITAIMEGADISEQADASKDKPLMNSDFLNGLKGGKAVNAAVSAIMDKDAGRGKVQYRLRDAVFSRQRYWGEPVPVYFKNDIPYVIEDGQLPVTLPPIDEYLPTEDGDPPLARAKKEDWDVFEGDRMELNTMPGWAGSSWYFLRYMDPHNTEEFVSEEKMKYWNQVDLYMGGAEHATGHLLYSRFWTKVLCDLGHLSFNEPFKKMINQGMILGRSSILNRDKANPNTYVCVSHLDDYNEKFPSPEYKTVDERFQKLRIDIHLTDNDSLDKEGLKAWQKEYFNAEFYPKDSGFSCGHEVEKMSKRWYNVEDPSVLCDKFGADTLRCYEMFLGPVEQSKPWDTKGINGVHNFLRKLSRLYIDKEGTLLVTDDAPSKDSMKTLHKTIKKVTEDLNRFSWNTVVSGMMIATNELTEQKCHSRAVLETLTLLLSPYAPHLAEELWEKLGHSDSVTIQEWPVFDETHLVESEIHYPVSFNGKMRFKITLPADFTKEQVEEAVLAYEKTAQYLPDGKPKKMIVVPGRIVNVVV
ncbi:MAG: leucyl-tRNA synthetase [Flavobacteriales bacterium]|jgi:leucyl-tRNA synthetase|tara:strand:+ start:9032 stop:11899 length:2868 start_codon:yes stop_codon:yes gene_type:complete